MKTQLLEDIGQSASFRSPAQASRVGIAQVQQERAEATPVAASSAVRSDLVWRYKTPGEHLPQPVPSAADALPAEVPIPAEAPIELVDLSTTLRADSVDDATPPAQHGDSRSDDLFDFSLPPAQADYARPPAPPESSGLDRWGKRAVFIGVGLIAAAMVVAGGTWFAREYRDDNSLARIARVLHETYAANKAAPTGPVADMSVSDAPPAKVEEAPVMNESDTTPPEVASSAIPPMVLLPRETAAVGQAELKAETMPRSERATQAPKRVREEREPARQPVRSEAVRADVKP